jgi:hypothetical protein
MPRHGPYLLAGAPSLISRSASFAKNSTEITPRCRWMNSAPLPPRDTPTLTRAASKINENLYASTALERGTLKIKSMQITWLPIQGPEQKAAKAKALEYMSAMMRAFTPTDESAKPAKAAKTADRRQKQTLFADTEGAVRYVVADNGEKGLTFAVEPIKLALSETLEGRINDKKQSLSRKISILFHRPCCPTGWPYSLIRLFSVEN